MRFIITGASSKLNIVIVNIEIKPIKLYLTRNNVSYTVVRILLCNIDLK